MGKDRRGFRKPPETATVREHFAWAYARLQMARTAVEKKSDELDWSVGVRFWREYLAGRCLMSSRTRVERWKAEQGRTCCYCGQGGRLQDEHVLPRSRGGPGDGGNSIRACRSCNASKGGRDMIAWFTQRHGRRPPLIVTEQYLKLAAKWCEAQGAMDTAFNEADDSEWPFDKASLRTGWPRTPEGCTLWPPAAGRTET